MVESQVNPSYQVEVTVICITYNHEKFIEDALKGFVSQKTNFKFKVIISEDSSQDNTRNIIERYVADYPHILELLPKIPRIGIGEASKHSNFIYTASFCKSRYVAICEGDDYWTDELKLQRQYDFLEENKDFSICFHPVVVTYTNKTQPQSEFPNSSTHRWLYVKGYGELNDLVKGNFIQTNSVLYRWRFLEENVLKIFPKNILPEDWFQHILHAQKGKIGFIDIPMSVYRKHDTGIWWSKSQNPIEVYLRYPQKMINFFRQLNLATSQAFSSICMSAQTHIFQELQRYYEGKADVVALKDLIINNSDVFYRLNKKHNSENRVKVSIIVTTFNQARYIRECLESLLRQEGDFDLEIIVGNDASTDETSQILTDFKDKIQVINRKSNMGNIPNLCDCIERSSGDYLAFCEGDDYWIDPLKIQKMLIFLESHLECVMVFNKLMLRESDKFRVHPTHQILDKSVLTFYDLLEDNFIGNFSACFYRTSVVKKIIPSVLTNPGADWFFNLCVSQKGDIGFLAEPLSVYRIHPNGVWSGLSEDTKLNLINSCKEEFKVFFNLKSAFKNTAPLKKELAPEKNIGEMFKKIVTQEIVCLQDNFTGVHLKVATYMRNNKGYLILSVFEDNRLIRKTSLPCDSLEDNSFTPFIFEPIPNSSGLRYLIQLSCIGSSIGSSPTIYYKPHADNSSLGLTLNNRRILGELSHIKIYSQEPKAV